MTESTSARSTLPTAAVPEAPPTDMPEDLPPGAFHRAAAYLGLTDDTPALVRGTRPWWTRVAVFGIGLLVMLALVAIGG